jgi:hypothetical protein
VPRHHDLAAGLDGGHQVPHGEHVHEQGQHSAELAGTDRTWWEDGRIVIILAETDEMQSSFRSGQSIPDGQGRLALSSAGGSKPWTFT